MPLRSFPAVAPPEPEVPDPGRPRPTPGPDCPFITWTPAGSDTPIILSTDPPETGIEKGVFGVDMPPEQQFRSQLQGDGAILRGRRALPIEIMLPISVYDVDFPNREQKRRSLLRMFNPRLGPGTLHWDVFDGEPRHINLLYSEGLSSPNGGYQGAGAISHIYQVVLIADDPSWYGELRTVSFASSVSGAFNQPFYPGPPFTIAGPGPGGTRDINIDSELETFPDIYMLGPMVTATWTLEAEDGGSLTLDLAPGLLDGEILRVRTGPGILSQDRFVRGEALPRPGGGFDIGSPTSAWGIGGDFPPLRSWILKSGANSVTSSFSGTTSESNAWLEYRKRFLSS